ncbi:hypothetical protein QYE76_047223 [Lolium multiflorum]|uniref:Uncharacterized protein n=1 Tax=Lolium multiflorum TaxID=4521 RepID=A0AAD8TNF0_LOLMU|nr:hypothetical protein QYE76_047223 [Lolium multiflorum]
MLWWFQKFLPRTSQEAFVKNVGLQSRSNSKLNNLSAAAVSAHVVDLEDQLKRSQDQSAEMKKELDAIKKKSEEEVASIKMKADVAEAAQAQRDKDYQALLTRTEDNDARVAHMMALFGSNNSSAGN